MNSSLRVSHAASIVAQSKKDRAPGLGRGPGPKNKLQSPKHNSLKLIQININGITTNSARIKLDQVLDLAEIYGVQIIVLQETKLRSDTHLKIKGYDIYRTDRQNKRGGGLMFLTRDIKYQSINISSNITGNSNLELQGIRFNWRGKYLNILNMYQPPDLNQIPVDLQNLFLPNTIFLGDLNAKHHMKRFVELGR